MFIVTNTSAIKSAVAGFRCGLRNPDQKRLHRYFTLPSVSYCRRIRFDSNKPFGFLKMPTWNQIQGQMRNDKNPVVFFDVSVGNMVSTVIPHPCQPQRSVLVPPNSVQFVFTCR